MHNETTRRAFVAGAAVAATSTAIAAPVLAATPDPNAELNALHAELLSMAERIKATDAMVGPMRCLLIDADYWHTPETCGQPQAVCDVLNEHAAQWCRDGGLPEAWWRRFFALEDRFMAIEPQTLRGAALQYSWRHEFNNTTWDDGKPPTWWVQDQLVRRRFRAFLHGDHPGS